MSETIELRGGPRDGKRIPTPEDLHEGYVMQYVPGGTAAIVSGKFTTHFYRCVMAEGEAPFFRYTGSDE